MFQIRSAKTTDVPAISKIASPLVDKRVLLGKEMVETYEAIQEFVVAEQDSKLLQCF
jgi:amino-acid N-acetyltransferase